MAGASLARPSDEEPSRPSTGGIGVLHLSVLREREPQGPRRCQECGTLLSRYNRSPRYCFVHEPKSYRAPNRW